MRLRLTYELGPWNDVFVSAWFLALTWIVFAINVAGILFSVYSLVLTVREGKFQWNLRTAVFLVAFVGFTLYTSSIPLRSTSYANKLMESISTWMISISFHMLLYLWSIFLMQVQRSRAIYAFRGLIAFGATVATFAFVTSIVRNNIEATAATRTLGEIIGYLLPITQGVIGVAFLYYAANFLLRGREAGKISQDTVAALKRLAQVAVIAFVGYFAVAVTNINAIVKLNTSPGVTATLTLVRMLSASVRGFAILAVMGVRQTQRKAGSTSGSFNPTGSTASSFRSMSTLAGKGGAYAGGDGDGGKEGKSMA
jgi:hypothetical protein